MKIAACQFQPVFGEIESNLDKIQTSLESIDADIVVLPELSTTGYQFVSHEEVKRHSESIPGGNSVQRLERICHTQNMYTVLGMAEEDNGCFYNSAVFIGPEGYIGRYRKVHLFDEEKIWFLPGNEGFKVWDTGQFKLGIMICFDWIFPESARTLALLGADIICHPTNLVLPYCQDAMMTRSIENRVFTITANRTGTEHRGSRHPLIFTGKSQATDPKGHRLFQLLPDKEDIGIADIDPQSAREKWITPRNHCLGDRIPELYYREDGLKGRS